MGNARRLSQKELTMLHEALETAAKWMQWWLDQRECECEGDHICGRNEREEDLKKIQAAESKFLEAVRLAEISPKDQCVLAIVAHCNDCRDTAHFVPDEDGDLSCIECGVRSIYKYGG